MSKMPNDFNNKICVNRNNIMYTGIMKNDMYEVVKEWQHGKQNVWYHEEQTVWHYEKEMYGNITNKMYGGRKKNIWWH